MTKWLAGAALALLLTGCLTPGESAPPEIEVLELGVGMVPPDSDWVLWELRGPPGEGIAAIDEATWDFPPSPSEAPSEACRVFGIGGTAFDRFWLPTAEWADPTPQGTLQRMELTIRDGSTGIVSQEVRLEGASLAESGIHVGAWNGYQPLYALFGLAERQEWPASGFKARIEAGGQSFTATQTAHGNMWCVSRLADFPSGAVVRTPLATRGENLVLEHEHANGALVWVSVSADIAYRVEVHGPQGLAAELDYDAAQDGVRVPFSSEEVLMCDPTPGTWSLAMPHIMGSEHRNVRVHAVVMDLTAQGMEAAACPHGHVSPSG